MVLLTRGCRLGLLSELPLLLQPVTDACILALCADATYCWPAAKQPAVGKGWCGACCWRPVVKTIPGASCWRPVEKRMKRMLPAMPPACASCGQRPPKLRLCVGCLATHCSGKRCVEEHWAQHRCACPALAGRRALGLLEEALFS